MTGLPSGVGLGWRPEIAGVFAGLANLAFSEVVAENVDALAAAEGLPESLAALAARVPVVPHGISLSLGSARRADLGDVDRLARVARLLDAPLVSEHLAFVRGGGLEAGHLLPCPRTRHAAAVLARNAANVAADLPVPLAVEVIAALLTWPEDELTDAQFATAVCERADVSLVLDIANVYANARNRGEDPAGALGAFPLERVAYCHIAGGVEERGVYLDTHTHPVSPPVLELAEVLGELAPGVPVLLERDGDYPAPAVLAAELEAIRARLVSGADRAAGAGHDAGPKRPVRVLPAGGAGPEPEGASGHDARTAGETLADRQSRLVSALIKGTDPPDGVNPEGIERTSRTLLRKRWAALRRHWPALSLVPLLAAGTAAGTAVGDAAGTAAGDARRAGGFEDFARWALEHRGAGGLPLGGFGDGLAYAADLERRGLLPWLAARDVAVARLGWRLAQDEHGVAQAPVRRRWRGVGFARAAGVAVAATGSAQQPRGIRVLGRPSG